MITEIEYKTKNLKGAYLYTPDNAAGPLPLIVWLTGGNDGAQLPLRFSLGKHIDRGKIAPECAVLMPAASYGHNYTTMTIDEVDDLLVLAYGLRSDLDMEGIAICGWSLGADAAAILTNEEPRFFARVCLLSNYPKAWGGEVPVADCRLLVGAKEKSAARDWTPYSVERVPGYGHEIGEKIWLVPEGVALLRWLAGA